MDFSAAGGPATTPCLILETAGRKSGQPHRLPLIYGKAAQNFVIVASKGGAPEHPAWFLNLQAQPAVKFQVADKKYRCRARAAASPEREKLFDMMAQLYPRISTISTRRNGGFPSWCWNRKRRLTDSRAP